MKCKISLSEALQTNQNHVCACVPVWNTCALWRDKSYNTEEEEEEEGEEEEEDVSRRHGISRCGGGKGAAAAGGELLQKT